MRANISCQRYLLGFYCNTALGYKLQFVLTVQVSRAAFCPTFCDNCDNHGLEHVRPPCPSPTFKVYSNSCPSSQWCHPTISSSVVPFSSCLQSFPASGSFLMSQFFASDGQSTGVSASASVLPVNIQDWFPLGWTGWNSWPLLSFPNLLTYWVQHFHSIIFQDFKQLNWTSITKVMLSEAHLTLHSRISGFRWVITPSWLSGLCRSFWYSSLVYSCHLFLIASASVWPIPFL